MVRNILLTLLLFPLSGISSAGSLTSNSYLLSSQNPVRVRLFTDSGPRYIFFRVNSGEYTLDCHDGRPFVLRKGEIVVIARFMNRIAVKPANKKGFEADSLYIKGSGINPSYALRTGSGIQGYRNYSGTLECFPDLGSLLLIGTLDVEDYVAGVVKAEGGSGKDTEYFKTQSVIGRTYTYKYLNKHSSDRYNLCDDTHCQVFRGLAGDSLINSAVKQTEKQVITTSDSLLIISAFHSNCGGETSPSEFVWLSAHPYLIKVIDPYCVTSKNASWKRSVSLKEWTDMLSRNGYKGGAGPSEAFVFRQRTRADNYASGSFTLPFRVIRTELNLRSSWFSVSANGDSLLLTGKGYGHGVGLCQEGAMVMAATGKKYHEIIRFYFPGVSLMNIENVKNPADDKIPADNKPSN